MLGFANARSVAVRVGLGCVACAVVLGAPAVFAVHEDFTYPAAIHAGTCEEPGDVVFELDDLARLPEDAPGEGERVGAPLAQVVHGLPEDFTIDATVEDLLADDHVLAVFGPEEGDGIIACGPIGAYTFDDEDGQSLAIGLREFNESNYTGVALFGDDTASDDDTETETETEDEGLEVEVYIVLNTFPPGTPAEATPIG
ncbi:MAG: hypothetical protein H0W06_04970 [Chloroflexia bacterium]|nr:hypothetical protein [Chloroflexia bacterium]